MPGGGEFQGREPCPWRILDDIGGAFAMGAVCGGVWHAGKGWRNAPKGKSFFYAVDAVKSRAPVTGGSFATWGALFATFDCSFAALRHKEDPWNSIASGAATGGLLAVRAGPRAAGKNALIGGVLLAAIEGLGIMITKLTAPPLPSPEDYANAGKEDPLEPPSMLPSFSGGSSISDIFGGSTDESSSTQSSSYDYFSESSSAESPPVAAAAEPQAKRKAWYNPF